MNFTAAYLAFLIASTTYRFRRLYKTYSNAPRMGMVYNRWVFTVMLFLYSIIFVGAIAEYCYYCVILHSREVNLFIAAIGLIMYVGVIPLRVRAIKALDKQVSQDIKILEEHELVKEGPYAYLRHPLALCVIIEVFGLTLIPNSYYSFLVALFAFLPFMIYRVRLEEAALIHRFGHSYLEYRHKVYAFVPVSILPVKFLHKK